MALALTEDRRSLADGARAFLVDRQGLPAACDLLEAPDEKLPAFWDELCTLGWPALHVPENLGGQGYGSLELAIVVAEVGRAVAPGPFLVTAGASAVLLASGTPQAARAHSLAATNWHQVHGGIAFTVEHGFHRLIRRGRMLDALLGAADDLAPEPGQHLLDTRQVPRTPQLPLEGASTS